MPRLGRRSSRTHSNRPNRRAPVAPVTVALKADAYSLGSPDFGQPSLTATDFPELIALQLAAVWHFKINARTGVYPKHDELLEYFLKCRLSNGVLLSGHLAKAFATACRPVPAMTGGNRKVK